VSGKALLLAAACLCTAALPERVCRHPSRGASRPVSLERAARARADLAESIRSAWKAPRAAARPGDWDSGLPACPLRAVRRVAASFPGALAGTTIGFGPAGSGPAADLRVATHLEAADWTRVDALADPALVARLGVRCWPTLARIVSEAELELVEDP
jgi:hypothetical protein